jgi:hypothetical protein
VRRVEGIQHLEVSESYHKESLGGIRPSNPFKDSAEKLQLEVLRKAS